MSDNWEEDDEEDEYEIDEDEMDSSDDWDKDQLNEEREYGLNEGGEYKPNEEEIDSSNDWDEDENQEDDDYPERCKDGEEDEDDDYDYPINGGSGEQFARIPLAPGNIQSIRFESDQKMVSKHALWIGLLSELRAELKKFMEDYRIVDAAWRHLFSEPLDPESMPFQRLQHVDSDASNLVHIYRPGMYTMSHNTWFDPGNEVTHKEELVALGQENFDAVLEDLGKYYSLGNLMVYGMGIFALVMCAARATLHKDREGTHLLNVLIGVNLVDGIDPEFVISNESGRLSEFKYKSETGLAIGSMERRYKITMWTKTSWLPRPQRKTPH